MTKLAHEAFSKLDSDDNGMLERSEASVGLRDLRVAVTGTELL